MAPTSLVMTAVVNQNQCAGCEACSECPVGAITYNDQNKCVVDSNLCVGCGQCESLCPVDAIKVQQVETKQEPAPQPQETQSKDAQLYPFFPQDIQKFQQSIKSSAVPIPVIYATQTQTTKQLATQLVRFMQLAKIKCQAIDVANLKVSDLQASTIIYLSCTFFMGDHPKSAMPFVTALRNKEKQWIDAIKGKYFAVFGLGSRKYKLFCKASDEIDELFGRNGGIKIQNAARVDRNVPEGHEPHFQQWMQETLENMGIGGIEDNSAVFETQMRSRYPYVQPPKSYFWARLIERKQLSDNVVDGVQHYYKFELPANHTYKAGQHIAILPRNHRGTLNELFRNRIVYLDEKCTMVAEPEFHVKINILQAEATNIPLSNDFYSVWDLIAQYTDLHAMASQNVLSQLSKYATNDEQKKELKLLGDPKNLEAFQEKFTKNSTNVADIFRIYPSIKIPIHRFLEVVPQMKHRLYSIASSPKLVGAQCLELIVTDVEWPAVDPKTGSAKKQRGLCTGFLYGLSESLGSYQATYFDRMGMFAAQIHESPLEPPADPMLPLITIALGSGYAPFRSILQERLALHNQGVKLGPMCLFLGIRRRADYGVMLEELNKWCKEGIASTYLAISRETETPVEHGDIPMTKEKRPNTVKITYGGHVTKSILDNHEVFGDHMTAPNNLILYCGKAGKIPEDLTENIIKSLGKYGISEPEARKMWAQYMENGRIFFEAW